MSEIAGHSPKTYNVFIQLWIVHFVMKVYAARLLALGLCSIFVAGVLLNYSPAMADSELYNESGGASSKQLREGNTVNEDRLFVGEEFTGSSSLIGETFNTVNLELIKVNSPDGTALVGLWSSSEVPTDSNYLCLVGTIDVATINSGDYTFLGNVTKSDGVCTIVSGSALGVLYDDAGTTTELFALRHSTTDVFDGANSRVTYYDHVSPAWADLTTGDIGMKVYLVESTACPDGFICFDTNEDGVIDVSFEDDGTGIISADLSDFPLLSGNLTQRMPFLLTATTGLPNDSANTILGIFVPVAFVAGLGLFASKYDVDNIPVMVYGLVFMGGMAVSVTLGWLEAWWVVVGIMGFIVSFASKIKGAFT